MKDCKIAKIVLFFICIFVSAIIVTFPCFATTATGTDTSGFTWQSDDGTAYTITGYTGSAASIAIPSTIDGGTVTRIGNNAFKDNGTITSVTIPDSVTSIDGFAFYHCSSLTSISIPNSVTNIGDSAFAYCISLPSITLPNNLSSIGDATFQDCRSFTQIAIPSSVHRIGFYAFFECINLTSISIPDGVNSIGQNAFEGCANLQSATMPDSVTTIGDALFYNCQKLTSVRLSDSLTDIGNDIFRKCFSLSTVTLPSHLTSIGNSAFEDCKSLNAITIPSGVTAIGYRAFIMCNSLNNVTIPQGVRTIGFNAFAHCYSFTRVIIPDSVTYLDDYTFYYCTSLTEATIPRSVTGIGSFVFDNHGTGFVIKGFGGSFAHNYATSNNLSFQAYPCTVTFDSANGSAAATSQVAYNTPIEKPSDPARNGYIFAGWYGQSTYLSQWNFANPITEDTTLFAKWEQVVQSLQVSFITNTAQTLPPVSVASGSLIPVPAPPTNVGYTLVGWYKDSAFNNPWNFQTDVVTSDTTIYAKWGQAMPNFQVSFVTNTAQTLPPISVASGSLIPVPATLTYVGYTFIGWYKDFALNSPWNFQTDVVTSDTTIYAKWEQVVQSFQVSFVTNTAQTLPPISVASGSLIPIPATPTYVGYTLIGWYMDSAFHSPWNFQTDAVTTDTTIYAKWERTICLITYETNGGTPIAPTSLLSFKVLPKPKAPKNAGYRFGGWYLDSAFINPLPTKFAPTENTTIYAKWNKQRFNITFVTNTKTPNKLVKVAETGDTIVLPLPTDLSKLGYTFVGWYKDSQFTIPWDLDTQIFAKTNIYASWKQDTYTVTFDTNGGGAIPSIQLLSLSKVLKVIPVRTGYTFKGWYSDVNLSSKWLPSAKITSNITLYASWAIKKYIVAFKTNTTQLLKPIKAEYGSNLTAPAPLNKTGYTFCGWYTDATFTDQWDFGEDIVTGNIRLFAKWVQN